jgi:uncharacterized protein YyaL (SSP411 family)
VLLGEFQDPDGGFFFTGERAERLIHRSKTFDDESMPSGNGVAASVLCRLGYLLGELRYIEAAERTLTAAARTLAGHPRSHMSMLNALDEFLASTQIVIIRGDGDEPQRWARDLGALYAPTRMIFAIPDDAPQLPASLAAKRPLCTGMTCSAPLEELRDVARRLTARLNL